jgi:hypothetical protein
MSIDQIEILVNPYTAIRLFAKTYLSIGETLFTDRKYKITREAWIGSMFLLALKNQSDEEWYFKPETISGSPDFYCYTFLHDKSRGGSIKPEIKLEVFEWRKEEKEKDFIEALKRIKLDKIIDPQITIVCYIRRNEKIPPAIELNKRLKEIKPKVKDIWYLGDVTPDSKTWRITQIYPNTLAIDLDYDQALTIKEEHSFIHSFRGKSDKLEYEPTGKQVRLTPTFDLIIE